MELEWNEGDARRFVGKGDGKGNEDSPPNELYAYSVIMIFKDGPANVAGFALSPSRPRAEKAALAAAVKMYKDCKPDYVSHSVHALKLDPVMLEGIKEAYGLEDKLQLWREQLKGETK